jgi:hypothetical protein
VRGFCAAATLLGLQVLLGGVGNGVYDSEIFDSPQIGVFMQVGRGLELGQYCSHDYTGHRDAPPPVP